jgi:hypothetical protein
MIHSRVTKKVLFGEAQTDMVLCFFRSGQKAPRFSPAKRLRTFKDASRITIKCRRPVSKSAPDFLSGRS